MSPAPHPRGFTDTFWLQWHLTDACNLACRHCYRAPDAAGSERPLEQLEAVLDAFLRFLTHHGFSGRLQLCGGEPLLARSLLPLIRRARRAGLPCRVLSNGTVATPGLARELLETGAPLVQVSLDGGPEVHDALRGDGAFARATDGARHLARAGVEVTIAATLSQANLDQIEAVLDAAVAVGAKRAAFSRLVPQGAGAALRDELLTAAQWGAAQVTMREQARRRGVALMPRDPTFVRFFDAPRRRGVARCEPLSGCAAGSNGFAVEPDGAVFPCRRLPISIGNVFVDDFDALWRHPLMLALRDRDQLGGACGRCERRWRCGGCRAVAFALSGDPFAEDPQCPDHAPVLDRAGLAVRRRWYRFLRENG